MSEPLRILMVTDAPWDRRLGGPRVQIELGEEFERLGHTVDHFALEDAFPQQPRMPRLAGFVRDFPRQAERWIRRHPNRYDVIDARSGSLIAPKHKLGFNGLLVTRSNGLLPIYEREFLITLRRTSRAARGRLGTRLLRRNQRRQLARRARLGFEHCDLLNVLNSDEEAFAKEELGMGDKTVKLLHGLTRERFAAFRAARTSPDRRLAAPVVAFIGSWDLRKGRVDAAVYVNAVRARAPGATFRFLGTGASREEVVADCGGDGEGIEVIPKFWSEELPELLGDTSVGIMPSYVEGFPFSILELLAAAAPVVAYDAPGARETLPLVDPSLLVTRGNAAKLGQQVADILTMDERDYTRLSERADKIAASLSWEEVAAQTIAVYRNRLSEVRGD
jgi:glycosyltransferase involved in cell wall biosynthesis